MAIGRILVPVRGDGKGEGVLGYAAALGRRHNAHLWIVHARATADDMIPYGVVVPSFLRKQIRDNAAKLAGEEEAHLVERLKSVLPGLGYSFDESEPPAQDRPTASWHEETGKQAEVIRKHGILADVVVVAKPDRDANLGMNSLRAAIYRTGRPVMMCPEGGEAPETLGKRVAIGWNGTAAAARAVAMCPLILGEAEEIVVLDGSAGKTVNTGEAFLRYLATRGLSAKLHPIDGAGDPGAALLEQSAAVGADLLLMGAYSHSREHETIFGGATQHVVDHAGMPVLLVH